MTKGARNFQIALTRKSARLAVLASMLAALAPAASTPAAATGFFEALFGTHNRGPAPVAVAPAPRFEIAPAPRPRPARPRVKREAPVKTVAEHVPLKITPSRPVALQGPLGPFLLDPTLRRGDAVVTRAGIQIFSGAAGSQHTRADFTPLPKAAGLLSGKPGELQSIEKASRLVAEAAEPPSQAPTVADAGTAGKQAAAQLPILASR